MIDPESLQVKIHLAEHWIPLIQNGDSVDIQIDALSDSVHTGQIKRIYPTIDASTRKGTVEIEFKPAPFGAQAGQLARVYLKTRPANKLVVPAHTIHHDSKGAYVYLVNEESEANKIYVQKGVQYGETIEITNGLHANDAIVIKGFNGLRHGKKVTVHNMDVNKAAEDVAKSP
jgi:membrane fusion protein (multidrug efflux system)